MLHTRSATTPPVTKIAFSVGLAVIVMLFAIISMAPASASVNTQLATAQDQLANCQLLVAHSMGTQRTRAQQCVADQQAIIKLLQPATPTTQSTPTPSVTPSDTPPQSPPPSTSPTSPSQTPTTTRTPTAPPSTTTCPAWPAVPDANCTGYVHTGVTLHDCALRLATAGATYDSCRFNGTVVIAAANIKVTRSLVLGGHVESNSNADLRNAVFTDVQISGPGNDGSAAIGNNNYTCLRCNVTGGNRGFALGHNVVIQDSYAHDFWVQPSTQNSAHQTAISTHGGNNYQILHSNLRCNSDHYACSSGFSFYAEDEDINDVLIQNCRITTDAGYGMLFGTFIQGKPYGITNTRVLNNVIDSDEYGPVGDWPGDQAGNVWSGNVRANGQVINP
jgi:hypothetical protein